MFFDFKFVSTLNKQIREEKKYFVQPITFTKKHLTCEVIHSLQVLDKLK